MGAVDFAGMAPDIVLPGQTEGQLLVLPVVPAHVNGIAVGGFKAHGGQFPLLHPLFPRVGPEVPSVLQLPANLLQLRLGLGPVQLLQHALQIAQLRLAQFDLAGQFLFRVFHPGVVLVEFRGVALGGQGGGQRNVDLPHIFVIKILAPHHCLALHHPVEVGGEDVPQLPQPLPVIGGQ